MYTFTNCFKPARVFEHALATLLYSPSLFPTFTKRMNIARRVHRFPVGLVSSNFVIKIPLRTDRSLIARLVSGKLLRDVIRTRVFPVQSSTLNPPSDRPFVRGHFKLTWDCSETLNFKRGAAKQSSVEPERNFCRETTIASIIQSSRGQLYWRRNFQVSMKCTPTCRLFPPEAPSRRARSRERNQFTNLRRLLKLCEYSAEKFINPWIFPF